MQEQRTEVCRAEQDRCLLVRNIQKDLDYYIITCSQFLGRYLEEYMCKEDDFTQMTTLPLLEESTCGTKSLGGFCWDGLSSTR